jgi:hypothetical protein
VCVHVLTQGVWTRPVSSLMPLGAEQDPAFNQAANKSSSFDVARG